MPPPTLIEDPSSPLGAEDAAGENENFKTGRTERMILSGVFLACSIVAPIIIALLVDPISKCVEKGGPAQSLHSQKGGSESEPCPLFGIRNGGEAFVGQILFLRLFSSSRRDRVLAIFSPKEVVSGEIGKGIRFRK